MCLRPLCPHLSGALALFHTPELMLSLHPSQRHCFKQLSQLPSISSLKRASKAEDYIHAFPLTLPASSCLAPLRAQEDQKTEQMFHKVLRDELRSLKQLLGDVAYKRRSISCTSSECRVPAVNFYGKAPGAKEILLCSVSGFDLPEGDVKAAHIYPQSWPRSFLVRPKGRARCGGFLKGLC